MGSGRGRHCCHLISICISISISSQNYFKTKHKGRVSSLGYIVRRPSYVTDFQFGSVTCQITCSYLTKQTFISSFSEFSLCYQYPFWPTHNQILFCLYFKASVRSIRESLSLEGGAYYILGDGETQKN